jgi:hypothetical protein
MTPITASSHLPPAGEPRFGVTPLSPRRLQLHALQRRSGQNRPVDRRRAKLATTIVDPPPITLASASTTQAAAPSNPHKRQTARAAPRGFLPGGLSEVGPQYAWIGHDGPASESLHRSRPFRSDRRILCSAKA